MTSCDASARVARAVQESDSIFLAAHENPDADSVGSLLALRDMLLALGKTVHAATPDPAPDRFSFLDGFAALTTEPPPWTPDLAIALDCDGETRLAALQQPFAAAATTADIDHHRGVSAFGDIRWVVPEAPATAALVAELARELGSPLTPSRAEALYVGLIADTGGFRFTNTSPAALRLGAELVAAGADPSELARCVFTIRPLAAALLEARALVSLEMAADGVLLASLGVADFAETGAGPADTDGLIDLFRDVIGVRTAVLLKESEPDVWQVSLRGNGVDVAGVAASFGGGGHRFAAGYTAEGDLAQVRRRVVDALTSAAGGADVEGLLNVLKPPGMTSHDIVDGVRRILNTRRVGHTGTLDPAAAGVMVLMIGATTRLSEFLTTHPKVYRAEITFGVATDTLDGEGAVIDRADASELDEASVRGALAELTGELQIVPPMYSAVSHEGRRLYDIARSGGTVEVEARTSVIDRFELLDFQPGEFARALTEVACSSGTYVRSLAAMAGEIVGLPACLTVLVRTRVGTQEIADALTGRELIQAVRDGRLGEVLIAPEDALADWPRLVADAGTARNLRNGMQVAAWQPVEAGHLLVMLEDGRLLCMAEALEGGDGPAIQPRRVLLAEDVPGP